MPMTGGWLGCDSFVYTVNPSFPSLMTVGTDVLLFQWHTPQGQLIKQVGPFSTDSRVNNVPGVTFDDARNCTMSSANFAAEAVGALVAVNPLMPESTAINIWLELTNNQLNLDVWSGCDHITINIKEGATLTNRLDAKYYLDPVELAITCF